MKLAEMSKVTAKSRIQVILFFVGKLEKKIKIIKYKSYTYSCEPWKNSEDHGQNTCEIYSVNMASEGPLLNITAALYLLQVTNFRCTVFCLLKRVETEIWKGTPR